jgi:hypothetical protein
VVSFTPRLLHLRGRNLRYSFDRRLGGPQIQFGCSSKEKNAQHCSCRELKPDRLARRLVTILLELPREPILTKVKFARHLVMYTFPSNKSRDFSVGIALGYGLGDRGSRVWFPEEAGNFSLHQRVQNGSGAHPASYPMGTRGSFPGGKAAGAWSWPLTSIYCRGQRISGAILPLPQYAFMAWCSVKAQGYIYLLPLPLHSRPIPDEIFGDFRMCPDKRHMAMSHLSVDLWLMLWA